tara:strand:+ start:311 stop:1174 length:864 start_codon:yes stop_codon:yes gene_type:complete
MLRKIKIFLKSIYSKIRGQKGKFIKINLEDTFPSFAPRSGGDFFEKSKLTIESINETFPAINLLIENIHSFSKPLGSNLVKDIKEVLEDNSDILVCEELANLFRHYGSDKAAKHDYYWFYGKLLKNRKEIKKILEIGLGTNNLDVISNMGKDGKPGASLRAFRDFCPNAQIYGADIDERILFTEERIKTFDLDQTKLNTFNNLSKLIGYDFDLIIDDGLHEPLANINSLNFALKHIKKNGWIVIEDIYISSLPIWENINFLFQGTDYETFLYKNKNNRFIFAVHKPK